jgi:serine protease Do
MKRWSCAAACLLLGAFLGSYFLAPLVHGQAKQPTPVPKELTSYRDIVKRVLPAVVSLDAKLKPKAKAGLAGDVIAAQQPAEPPKGGFGSGVLIDAHGVVLTSFHVVENAEAVLVTMLDGRKFVSQDIRGDRKTDLAIVVLDTKGSGALPFLALGDSEAMEIGDRVLAVGAPFGLAGSVTHGIISGKGRSGMNLNLYEDFLQTDAAINPGNSGGPLIGLDGKVIGISAAIKSKTGGFQGVGLAVASNLAKTIVHALLTDGVVRRGYLGLQARELSPELAAKLGLGKQPGVVVGEVYDNTPASKAGLQSGDVITSLGGKAVSDSKMLETVVLSLPLNKAAGITILRGGKAMTLKVTIEEQPENFGVPRPPGQQQQQQQGMNERRPGPVQVYHSSETRDRFATTRFPQGDGAWRLL